MCVGDTARSPRRFAISCETSSKSITAWNCGREARHRRTGIYGIFRTSHVISELHFYIRIRNMSVARRGLEVDGFFSSSSDAIARTVFTETTRTVGTQTDSVPVDKRVVRRVVLGKVDKDVVTPAPPAWVPSKAIAIPARLPIKRSPETRVEDVWKALHSRPPPGKRLTVHKTGCRCFLCGRTSSAKLAGESDHGSAVPTTSVIVTPTSAVDVDEGRVAAHAE